MNRHFMFQPSTRDSHCTKQSRLSLLGLAPLTLLVLLTGCAARMNVIVDRERPPLPADCPVDILKARDIPLDRYEQLGTISFGDTGASLICDRASIEKSLRAQACRLGANAALVVHEEFPDLWSSCYRVSAKLVVLSK